MSRWDDEQGVGSQARGQPEPAPPTAAAHSFFGALLVSSFHSCYFYSKICLQLSVCHLQALWCPDPAPAAVILASTLHSPPPGRPHSLRDPVGALPLTSLPLASAYCPDLPAPPPPAPGPTQVQLSLQKLPTA